MTKSATGPTTPPTDRPPGRRRNLTEQVFGHIASRISEGELPLGHRLPTEFELARTMGVSRAVVREAISRLKQDGLVETRQGSGAFVTSTRPAGSFRFNREELDGDRGQLAQVFELRLSLEGDAAGYAAARRSDADLAQIADGLAAIAADMRKGKDGIDADFAFHGAIAKATGNAFILRLVDLLGVQLKESIRVARINSSSYRGRPEAVLAEHTEIYEAIVEKRIDAARGAARRHVMNAARRLDLSIGI